MTERIRNMVKYEYVPGLAPSVVDQANTSVEKAMTGRSAFDSVMAVAVQEAQYRVELQLQILQHPNEVVRWPTTGLAVIGFVPA
jgi:hypothetical protein